MANERQSRQQSGERTQGDLSSGQYGAGTERDAGRQAQQETRSSSYGSPSQPGYGEGGQSSFNRNQPPSGAYGGTGSRSQEREQPGLKQGRGESRYGGRHPMLQGSSMYPMGSGMGFGPFSMLRQFNEEMDRLFDSISSGFSSGFEQGYGRGGHGGALRGMQSFWSPHIEMRERDGKLEIEADLPGMSRNDVHVEIEQDHIVIHGERSQQRENEQQGYYHSERSYGTFYRVISLPEGIDADSARATFRDGVLRIEVPMPQQRSRGRELEIRDGESVSGSTSGSVPGSQGSGTAAGSSYSGGQGAASTYGGTASAGSSGAAQGATGGAQSSGSGYGSSGGGSRT